MSKPAGRSRDPHEKYERGEIIGKGSFGNAVKVKDKRSGIYYVSKEIDINALSDKDRALAKNEVEVLTRVEHPNIIRYIEHYLREGTLYIIMEYADGGDLHKRIQQHKKTGKKFSEEQVTSWFIQMCLAVKHLHDRKILHRDLKSANIFLTQDNVVKMGDFGFGKVMANTIAQAKTLCGTPYYFSPELCMGKPYNNKTDIWALGCILAEMCLLDHAYNAKNIKDLMRRVIKGTYQPIPQSYCQEIHNLVANMLTKDHVLRPNIGSILQMEYVQGRLKAFTASFAEQFQKAQAADTAPIPKIEERRKSREEMEKWVAADAAKKREEEQKKEKEDMGMGKVKFNANQKKDLKAFLSGPPPGEVDSLEKFAEAKGLKPPSRPGTSSGLDSKLTGLSSGRKESNALGESNMPDIGSLAFSTRSLPDEEDFADDDAMPPLTEANGAISLE